MRQFSPRAQYGLSVAIGIGMAVCGCLLYGAIIAMSDGGDSNMGFAFLILLPGAMLASAIGAGRLLRRVASPSWGSMKSLLATPALYLFLLTLIIELSENQFMGGMWILTLAVFAIMWPVTYFSFRLGRDTRTPDPNAPPTCGTCGYNLTGNVSGICPECGTPIDGELERNSDGCGGLPGSD